MSQVDVLLQLFNELDKIQRRQAQLDAEKEKKRQQQVGWGWADGGDNGVNGASGDNGGNGGNGNGGGSDLAAPTVVLMVQRFSVPEPNTSEAGVKAILLKIVPPPF